jgi:hypothetical protein
MPPNYHKQYADSYHQRGKCVRCRRTNDRNPESRVCTTCSIKRQAYDRKRRATRVA